MFRQMIKRVSGALELRVIVRGPSSGAMGSVTVPFDDLAF